MPSPRCSEGSSLHNRSGVSATGSHDEWYMRSLLGSQAESRHESAPRYGFGTSQRAVHDIMYGGLGSDKGRPCRLSPGPIYMPDANGAGRGPKFSFGTGPAAGSCGSSANRGAAFEPGPGEYDINAAVGRQVTSLARSAPSYGWGSSVRNTGGAKVSFAPHAHIRTCRPPFPLLPFPTTTTTPPPYTDLTRARTLPILPTSSPWADVAG